MTNKVTASTFLVKAASQIGYREGRDANGNWNNLTKYGAWYGMNGVAWCAMFQSWTANEVGALWTRDLANPDGVVPKYASCTAGLSWFRARGQTGVWPPRPGDIFILCEYNPSAWNAQPNGWAPIHTGAVEKWVPDSNAPDFGTIITIEGNTNDTGSAQGNGVYRLQRRDSRTSDKIIYCRPAWAPEVVVPPMGGGGASAPPPKPPAPAPKPIAGSTYTGSRVIDVSAVRPGRRNEASRRMNGLMWAWLCKNSPAYARANVAAWMREPANLWGLQSQRALQETYRVLVGRKVPGVGLVTLPTWPGAKGVRAIGGTPV